MTIRAVPQTNHRRLDDHILDRLLPRFYDGRSIFFRISKRGCCANIVTAALRSGV
jgi:hypothetical protein